MGLNGRVTRLAVTHPGPVQNVQEILTLGEKEAITTMLNCNSQKMMKRTHISHREFLPKSCNNPVKETLGRSCEHNIINI
jgi:hypothetical protein